LFLKYRIFETIYIYID